MSKCLTLFFILNVFSIIRIDSCDTALHYAVEKNNIHSLASWLEEMNNKSAAPRHFNPRGNKLQTPLHRAVMMGNFPIVKLLCMYDIDIDSLDADGCAPLHYACQWSDGSIAKLLIERGARFDVFNRIGWAPLHVAIYYKNEAVLKILNKRKADLTLSEKWLGAPDGFKYQIIKDGVIDMEAFLGDLSRSICFSPLSIASILYKNQDPQEKTIKLLLKRALKQLEKKANTSHKVSRPLRSRYFDVDYVPLCSLPWPHVKNDFPSLELQTVRKIASLKSLENRRNSLPETESMYRVKK